jgi:hypothetical protein
VECNGCARLCERTRRFGHLRAARAPSFNVLTRGRPSTAWLCQAVPGHSQDLFCSGLHLLKSPPPLHYISSLPSRDRWSCWSRILSMSNGENSLPWAHNTRRERQRAGMGN